MDSLVSAYDSSSASTDERDTTKDVEPIDLNIVKSKLNFDFKPQNIVTKFTKTLDDQQIIVDYKTSSKVYFNPKIDELYKSDIGPENPFKSDYEKAARNVYAGHIQNFNIDPSTFDTQWKEFRKTGTAINPSNNSTNSMIYNETNAANQYIDEEKDFRKRKMQARGDPSDIENFKGPWANYIGIEEISKPSEEQQNQLDDMKITRMKQKALKYFSYNYSSHKRHDYGDPIVEPPSASENSILHIKNIYDYQGRSFLSVPKDQNVNLSATMPPHECKLPKKLSHTWKAHAKGVSVMQLFPNSGHLLLSGGNDNEIKLWKCYNDKELVISYSGHRKAIKDLTFNNDGTQFLSASYDRWVKLWDTETGKCIQKFSNNKIPMCVKFNPDQWDINERQIIQEYDRHLGPVNTITFFDSNQRIVTTSDDKSVRVWEWDIPIDTKYIADPAMSSIPSVTVSPNGRWLAGQAMNNKIVIYDLQNRVRERRRGYRGHNVSGYACQVGFSPDSQYIMCGDAEGKLYIWSWKQAKILSRFNAHKSVVIGCAWLPHEECKIVTCGWDGLIKMWT